MVGYVRLLLAIGVMLSHLGITVAGYNIGVMSVVVFFLLAGSTTSHLFDRIFAHHPQRLRAFYIDRIKRLFPLYFYVLAVVAVVVFSTGYGQPTTSLWMWLQNALIVPLNYYMVFSSDVLTEPASIAIPAAWSLGLELQIYALLPFLLLHKRLAIGVFVLSVSIYVVAASGAIDTDMWGYRLLPGTLFIFLIGAALRRAQKARHSLLSPWWLLWLAGLIFAVVDAYWWTDIRSYRLETLIGLVVGIPLLLMLRRLPWKLPGNRACADLSYGVFLTHGLAIWLIQWEMADNWSIGVKIILVLALSIMLAGPGVFLSNKLHKRLN